MAFCKSWVQTSRAAGRKSQRGQGAVSRQQRMLHLVGKHLELHVQLFDLAVSQHGKVSQHGNICPSVPMPTFANVEEKNACFVSSIKAIKAQMSSKCEGEKTTLLSMI